jgi:hypothetical protein
MKIKTVAILDKEEVKEAVIKFFAGVLTDQSNTEELLRSGDFHNFVPKINLLSPHQLANLHSELCMGDKLIAANPDWDLLLAEVNDDYILLAVQGQGIVTEQLSVLDVQNAINS